MRIHEEQRAPGDRAEERPGLGLRRDLGRKAFQGPTQTQGFFGTGLFGPVAIDRGGNDQHREGDNDDLGHELGHRSGLADHHAQRLHAEARREVRRHGGDETRSAQPVHGEGADSQDDDERDAARVRRAADHPHARGHEIREHDLRGNLVQSERVTPRPVEPPDARGRRNEEREGKRHERHDSLPTKPEPGDRSEARTDPSHKQRVARKYSPHPAVTIGRLPASQVSESWGGHHPNRSRQRARRACPWRGRGAALHDMVSVRAGGVCRPRRTRYVAPGLTRARWRISRRVRSLVGLLRTPGRGPVRCVQHGRRVVHDLRDRTAAGTRRVRRRSGRSSRRRRGARPGR